MCGVIVRINQGLHYPGSTVLQKSRIVKLTGKVVIKMVCSVIIHFFILVYYAINLKCSYLHVS